MDSMTLGQKQELFTKLKVQLISKMIVSGYQPREKELARTDEQSIINALGPDGRTALCDYLDNDPRWVGLAVAIANNPKIKGIVMSNHRVALAIDIDLFKDGVYLSRTEDHREFGEFWEKLHPLCRWGGRFSDGNHYSLEHEGRK
jgi:hypothetical protein